MSSVVPLFQTNQFAPDAESKAVYLEQVAAEIRAGTRTAHRCVLIIETDADGDWGLDVLPFGDATDFAAQVGLITMAQLKAALY